MIESGTDDERSTVVTDLVTSICQGIVIGGIVLIAVLIGYLIVAVGQ
jgi:hypothetical protein